MPTRIVVLFALCTLQACAGLLTDDARTLAEQDDAACTARGLEWPSAEYEECRYDRAERRQQRDWRNLRMIEPRRPDQSTAPAAEPYQPLSRARFRCRERDDGDSRWIECDV